MANNHKMTKKFIIIGIVLVVVAIAVLVALGVWVGSVLTGGASGAGPSPYSVVSLASGEIYFGKLSWFPTPRLKNVWMVQVSVDKDNQRQVNIAQFDKSFWSPVDEINFNPKEILWWSRLRSDSQVVKVLENPQSVQQQGAQGQPSGDDFKGPSAPPPSAK